MMRQEVPTRNQILKTLLLAICFGWSQLNAQSSNGLVELEGIDSAFMHLESGFESKITAIKNVLNLTTTSKKWFDQWRWNHDASSNSFTLSKDRIFETHRLSRPLMHFEPDLSVAFGDDQTLGNFDFVGSSIGSRIEFNLANSKQLAIDAGITSTFHRPSFGFLKFGTNNQSFLTISPIEVIAEKQIETRGNFVIQEGNKILDQWNLSLGVHSCGEFTTNGHILFWNSRNGLVARLDQNGSYCSISDFRAKKDVNQLPSVLTDYRLLRPMSYHYISQDNNRPKSLGLIAQEVEEIFPELVSYSPSEDQYSLKYAPLSVISIRAFQELEPEMENLAARIMRLEQLILDNAK